MPSLPFEGLVDKTDLSIQDKIALFGDRVIPLFLPWGSKGDTQEGCAFNLVEGYQKRTPEFCLEPRYQATLLAPEPHNVAMSQGRNGLTPILGWDFDLWNMEPAERFLEANPFARENALITTGEKGFTLWFRVLGLYPGTNIRSVWENRPEIKRKDAQGRKIKDREWEHLEWRVNGYSVIHGLHPAGMLYRIYTVGTGIIEVPWTGSWKSPDAIHAFNNWPGIKCEKRIRPEQLVSKELFTQRLKIFEDLYGPILGIIDEGHRVQITCPNDEAHSRDSGDGQTVILGANGLYPTFNCLHAACETEVNPTQKQRLREALLEAETITIYGDSRDRMGRISCVRKWRESGNFYRRSDSHPYQIIYWQTDMDSPIDLGVRTFRDCNDREGIKFSKALKKSMKECYPTREQSEYFMHQPETGELTLVKSISPKALLCKTQDGAQILARQFSEELSIIILGKEEDIPGLTVSFDEGRAKILDLCSCLKFKTPADQSRAIAQLLTPALIQGGFIERPAPIFLMASDLKGAGKSQWNFGLGDIYQEEIAPNTYEKTTLINGLSEIIRKTIEARRNFLFIDDLIKMVESPLLNAICTSKNAAEIRTAFREFTLVPIDHLSIAMAGVRTKFTLEEQLASRVLPACIIKDELRRAPDGTFMPQWIKTNAQKILAGIYSIITRWAGSGYPLGKAESRFPVWAQCVNGILEKILELEPCTDHLEDLQNNTSDQNSNWLEQIIPTLKEEGLLWEGNNQGAIALSLSELREFILSSGLAIPGNYPLNSQDTSAIQRRILGRTIKRLKIFREIKGKYTLFTLGDFFVKSVQEGHDTSRNPNYKYIFCNTDREPAQTRALSDDAII
jgi:hypothetical protein